MKTFSTFINEGFDNLFLKDIDAREKVADEVWDILQKSYAPIGGLKGHGFGSKEEMIKTIPFWKISKKNGKIVAIAFYKDKNGRKMVAAGTNRSNEGKKSLADMLIGDLKQNRAYAEISKAMIGFMVKNIGFDNLKKYLKTPTEAAKILKKPIEQVDGNDSELKKYPVLKDYLYSRVVGDGVKLTKIMVGTSGNKIINY